MWLLVLTILSNICFGFLLDVRTQSSRNAEFIDEDLVTILDAKVKALSSNYHNLLITVQNDRSEIDSLNKQNQVLNQRLNKTEDNVEKLITNEESLTHQILALQNNSLQQQRELDKEKSTSKKSRNSMESSFTLLNNLLQELTNSTSIGFENLNDNVLKEKQLLIVRDEMRKFEKRIKQRINSSRGKTVDGQWSSWIDTPSSATCGVGCRLRYRECSNPYPQQGGEKCTGSRNKHVTCLQYDPCPVHGAWSVWSETTCSVTCGVGTRLRSRNCSNPHPQYGGNNCTGKSIEFVTCSQPYKCPVHGAWSAWSENTCSVTCGVGTSLRSRNCSNPHPQYGGNNCTGNSIDYVTCTQLNTCPVDGKWSRWIEKPCSGTCGVGSRLRYRQCSNPYPQHGGKNCRGNRTEHVKCLQYNPCPVHGAWSVWSETTCSVTCGVGTSLRSRNCSNPHPQYGGNNCTGNSTDYVTCSQPNECPATLICRADQFTCTQQFQCIPAARKCDGFADCSDRTDEEGCERCDARGSLSQLPDSVTRQCTCKANVYGRSCVQCKQNTFYLSVNNPYGCVSCFCMGVSQQCTSTFWNRAQIGAFFTRDRQGFSLGDISQRQEPTTEGFTVNSNVRELIYRRFNTLPRRVYYWSLPQRFLGDKVTSYGGNLTFGIRYRPGLDTSPQDTAAPLVEISGNDITLVYKDKTAPTPNTPEVYKVPLYEQFWTRPEGEPATREFLLMALADISALLIRATFTRDTDSASIRDVIMDIAEDRDTRLDRAYAVEQCACPTGYKGLSCEDCDVGYTRTGGGLYLGLCEPCQCNTHSSECDPETGTCKNCQHNTEGDACVRCAPGFYGDTRGGSPTSCQPCPCPLIESPNQFSPVCELSSDNQVTCTACSAGHTGRRCESCIQGYLGNPLKPGDYCKIGPVDCNCDSRGTVSNKQCDPNNLQCQCKSYVRGLRCYTCKDGYFYLDQSNHQGCMACWCNGLTNQCSSSSYYRNELSPQLGSDGSHNFTLTNRRLSNTITDGFELDFTRREVKFARLDSIQKERESLYFNLPPKFTGNKVESYGGYLRFTLETYVARDAGGTFRDVDIEIITSGQRQRMYHLFNPAVKLFDANLYEILLRESNFQLSDGSTPTREAFLRILSDIEAILIRATYHSITSYTSLRDLRMDTAVPEITNLGRAPMVESCRCPEGYKGLSCEKCAVGYLKNTNNRCIRCSCNGHASACDPATGVCLNCQENTEGERCERCATGYYGDSTTGTPNDCRPCPCPLTVPSNQFSRSCYLESDGLVTCDRCPPGYIGRTCERCDTDRGYTGNPTEVGGRCQRDVVLKPVVTVNPTELEDTVGQTIVFQCNVQGPGPFNVIWSRIDGQDLPNRAKVGPRYSLTIRDVQETDAGRYVCTATNVHGSNIQYVNLIVLDKQQPIRVYIDLPKERSVDEGQSVRFVCMAKGEMQLNYFILSWSKINGLMPNKAIDQGGVLVIPNVRPEDGGTYECTGSDMFSMDTDRATLRVSAQQVQPTVRIEPTFQTVNEFETAEFRCVTTGRPAPTVEWRRGTGTMNPSAVISGDVLRISAALGSDEAQYFCKASNVAGTTEVRTILLVKSKVLKPVVTVNPTELEVTVGQTIVFQCNVQGPGPFNVIWSRIDGQDLPNRAKVGPRYSLTIRDVQETDAGRYVCTATNAHGSNIQYVNLIVLDKQQPIRVYIDLPKERSVDEGQSVRFVCMAKGEMQLNYFILSWSKINGLMPNKAIDQGGVLVIPNVRPEDGGTYECTGSDMFSMDTDRATLRVSAQQVQPTVRIEPTFQTVNEFETAEFRCVTTGRPAPTVEWRRGTGTMNPSAVISGDVLRISAALGSDEAQYFCKASNVAGTTEVITILLVKSKMK